jgi:hypothetical protein
MRHAAERRYGDRVPTDPAPFLSTIILASAGLVAIIGGLLVARFVGLDTDEQSNRRVLSDAAARLASARRRAVDARSNLVAWEARDFLLDRDVLTSIGQGASDLETLRRLNDSSLSDQELRPFVAEVNDEFTRAREALAAPMATSPDDDWERFRRTIPDLPDMRWPRVWEEVFDQLAAEHIEEIAKKQAAEAAARRRQAGPFGFNLPDMSRIRMPPSSDYRATSARRYDDLVAADQRAQQRVEDYEDELRRLREAHEEIVRPDARLWWGVGILVAFAIVGVALPTWIMSRGPGDLAAVRWVVYPFGSALAILLVYIVVYLAQLIRRKPPPIGAGGDDDDATPGA